MRKFIKHLSLIIIAGLICYLLFDFGDYCSGVGLIFIIPFLIILFIINIVLLSIYNEHKNEKNKSDRNIITKLYFLCTTGAILLFFFIRYLYHQSYETIWVGESQENNRVSLTLLDDNHFELKYRTNHYGCVQKGKYEERGNYIYLKRKDIIENYDIKLDSVYYFDKDKSKLIPQNRNSKILPFDIIK